MSRPNQFVAYRSRDYDPYANDARLGRAMRSALAEKGIPAADVREASREGKYVSSGIATIDNGATAILTERAQLFRTGLFDTDWNGYLWLKAEKRKDAYRIAGRNIVMAQKPPGDTDAFSSCYHRSIRPTSCSIGNRPAGRSSLRAAIRRPMPVRRWRSCATNRRFASATWSWRR